MTEPSLEEQVLILQAQLAAAKARISCLESEADHPSEAYSGTEMIQALLNSAHEDPTDGQLKQLTGFFSLIRQHEPMGATDFRHLPRSCWMTSMQLSQYSLESHKMNSFVRWTPFCNHRPCNALSSKPKLQQQ
jgi:hypothetical protein